MCCSQYEEIHWKEGIKASFIIQHEVSQRLIRSGIDTEFHDKDNQRHDVMNWYQGKADTKGQGNYKMANKGLILE